LSHLRRHCSLLAVAALNGIPGVTPGTPTDNNPGQLGVLTGRFVDSAVAGLQYATATQSGVTESDGSYDYLAGESVTFSIGDITLPTIPATEVVTPLSVFSTSVITDIRVMNLARLLQTLDTDGDPVNGIVLADAASASATGLNVDFAADSFDTDVVNLVANAGAANTSLVEGMAALEHLQETLFDEGVEERPTAPPVNAPPSTIASGNPTTHPLVGTTAEFTNIQHGIAGTLTILDDRTIQVSNFSYDGGGITVFFYTGVDGNYISGREIGPQLNGRPYNNETLPPITLPDNLTLDDFNGLSVWCVPFAFNFGDARF